MNVWLPQIQGAGPELEPPGLEQNGEVLTSQSRLEGRWRGIFENSVIGISLADSGGRILVANAAFQEMLGYSEQELQALTFLEITCEADREANRAMVLELIAGKRHQFQFEKRYRRKDGRLIWASINVSMVPGDANSPRGFMAICENITERKRTEAVLAGEKRVLEMIAGGRELGSILDRLCREAEEISCGSSCFGEEKASELLVSILLLDSEGKRLRHGAAPSLPKSYTQAIDGAQIGPRAGSCGTAAFRKKPVIVSDIATDQLWAEYRLLALPHGLRACWSTPIFSTTREVMGTFALYSRQPGEPSAQQRNLIEQLTHLAAIAIERTRAEEALKQAAEALGSSAQLARGQAEALSRTLDALAMESAPDRLVEHVLRTIIAQLDGHSAAVWLRNQASGLVNFEFAFENGKLLTKSDAALAKISPALKIEDVQPWPEIFRSGKPSLLEDIRKGPFFPWREHVLALGVIAILTVPMVVAGQVEGVIGIRFTRKRKFRTEEMELAQALAHQAMLAIQLMRLSYQSREAAVTAERNRMARDIHDTLAQGFTGVIVQLEAAADATSEGLVKEANEHIARASELARGSLQEARRSVRALRPQALEERDLCGALEELIKQQTTGTALQGELAIEGEPRAIPPAWGENLLRIGQEVLTNSLRHASATEFQARLSFDKDEVRLTLRDNGRGFDPARKHDGFGLLGIRERVEGMGGRLTIQSGIKEGAMISIALPYATNPRTV